MLSFAWMLLTILRFMGPPTSGWTLDEIKEAAQRWGSNRPRRSLSGAKWTCKFFIQAASDWARFLGRLREPTPEPKPFAREAERFFVWMREERNLASTTIKTRRRHVEEFLVWFRSRKNSLQRALASDVNDFLASQSGRWARRTIAICSHTLRVFFRFCGGRDLCRPSVYAGILCPRLYREESLPAGPSWEDVGRLLNSLTGKKPSDVRDRAIIMLLAVYGLRAGEVSGLLLEDVDFGRKELSVYRSKSGARHRYPLVEPVARTIADYLRQRRTCTLKELFLTIKGPFKPVSRLSVSNAVGYRLAALNVPLLHHGAHSLRHACAAHLVSEGLSLKEIGDHLGHRSSAATRIYAKVDLAGLRQVASFDLGAVL
jgi:site-specific recombinase XerD